MKSVWDSDFTEGEELQDDVLKELDSAALIEALHQLGNNLTHWLTDDTDEGIYIIKIIHYLPSVNSLVISNQLTYLHISCEMFN